MGEFISFKPYHKGHYINRLEYKQLLAKIEEELLMTKGNSDKFLDLTQKRSNWHALLLLLP